MSHEVVVEPAARADIRSAHDWYERRSAGLGAQFLQAVAQAIGRIEQDALAFRLEREQFRRVHLRKFPYALHFMMRDRRAVVLACVHFRQSPQRWPGA